MLGSVGVVAYILVEDTMCSGHLVEVDFWGSFFFGGLLGDDAAIILTLVANF